MHHNSGKRLVLVTPFVPLLAVHKHAMGVKGAPCTRDFDTALLQNSCLMSCQRYTCPPLNNYCTSDVANSHEGPLLSIQSQPVVQVPTETAYQAGRGGSTLSLLTLLMSNYLTYVQTLYRNCVKRAQLMGYCVCSHLACRWQVQVYRSCIITRVLSDSQ